MCATSHKCWLVVRRHPVRQNPFASLRTTKLVCLERNRSSYVVMAIYLANLNKNLWWDDKTGWRFIQRFDPFRTTDSLHKNRRASFRRHFVIAAIFSNTGNWPMNSADGGCSSPHLKVRGRVVRWVLHCELIKSDNHRVFSMRGVRAVFSPERILYSRLNSVSDFGWVTWNYQAYLPCTVCGQSTKDSIDRPCNGDFNAECFPMHTKW